jgi:hypothetical protein
MTDPTENDTDLSKAASVAMATASYGVGKALEKMGLARSDPKTARILALVAVSSFLIGGGLELPATDAEAIKQLLAAMIDEGDMAGLPN